MNENFNPIKSSIVVFSASLYFFYLFIQLNLFNSLNASLMKDFQVSAAELGHLSAFYFYGNVALLLPAGILLDRTSVRKIILFSMGLIIFAVFLFSFTHHFWIAALARLMTGVGGVFCMLASIRLATRWFPPERMALVIGLIVTIAMIGGMIAQTPFTLLIEKMGWRQALLFDGVLGLLLFSIIFLFVKDYPPYYDITQEKGHLSLLGFWASLRLALMNKQNWLGGVYTSLLNLPIFLLGGLWGNIYLVQVHHLTPIQASYACSMIFVGTIIGSPIIGWLSDYLRLRKAPMLLFAVFSFITILLMMLLPQVNLFIAITLFLLLGFFTSAQIITYPLIAESNPIAITATASAINSFLIMSGGFTQPLFGWLMQIGNQTAMSIIPIGFLIGFFAALFLKETHCKPLSENQRK